MIADDFTIDVKTAALLSTAFTLPYALVQPVLGVTADFVGKTRLMNVCVLVIALAALGCALATTFSQLVALRIIAGVVAGGVFPVAMALLGDLVPIHQRQVAIALCEYLLCVLQNGVDVARIRRAQTRVPEILAKRIEQRHHHRLMARAYEHIAADDEKTLAGRGQCAQQQLRERVTTGQQRRKRRFVQGRVNARRRPVGQIVGHGLQKPHAVGVLHGALFP